MAVRTIDQPFSVGSIWNTPIGTDAAYQSRSGAETATILSKSGVVPWVSGNAIGVYQTKATDPIATWNYDARAATPEWQYGGQPWGGSFQMRTPQELQFKTVDGWAIIISEDGKHFVETWLGSYNPSNNSYHASYLARNDLTGDGIANVPGAHEGIRAAGMSLFGGLVRADELDDLSINHAVAMAISTTQAKAGSSESQQIVWPATTADGFSVGGYTGAIPMGALFAIPDNVDLTKIGIKTPEGMALAKAFQNYGGYVTDTAGDRTHNLAYIEEGASQQQINNLHTDIGVIRQQLAMVTNNSAANPGGPGARLVAGPDGAAPAPVDPTPTVPDPVPDEVDPPPASSPTPPSTPGVTTIGSGPDELILNISQDAYKGDAQYTVSVDGQQLGGTLTAHASHKAGESELIALRGDWAQGSHDIAVNFLNDAWDGTPATDRNLYVDPDTFNGVALPVGEQMLASAGVRHMSFRDSGTGSQEGLTIGSGPDKLLLRISQDAYKGDAEYTLSVDGQQVGGTLTAHASHQAGEADLITVRGNWGQGRHDVGVRFLNDAWDGTLATDRNLYVDPVTYNAAVLPLGERMLASEGEYHFPFHEYLA